MSRFKYIFWQARRGFWKYLWKCEKCTEYTKCREILSLLALNWTLKFSTTAWLFLKCSFVLIPIEVTVFNLQEFLKEPELKTNSIWKIVFNFARIRKISLVKLRQISVAFGRASFGKFIKQLASNKISNFIFSSWIFASPKTTGSKLFQNPFFGSCEGNVIIKTFYTYRANCLIISIVLRKCSTQVWNVQLIPDGQHFSFFDSCENLVYIEITVLCQTEQ